MKTTQHFSTFPAFILVSLASFGLLSGCGLPSAGPKASVIEGDANYSYAAVEKDEAGEPTLPYVLVNVDNSIVEALAKNDDALYFKGAFTDRTPPADTVLGVGDVIRVTVFEAGPGGLFSPSGSPNNNNPAGGSYTTLPDQEVDQRGTISIPYAGKDGSTGIIKARGRRLGEVQADIQKRLLNRAIEPQVMVTMVKRNSNQFAVIGNVNQPGRFPLDQGGVRVLEALSIAGGPKENDYNTLITLQRGANSATVRLSTLLTQPENNIFIQPGDMIAVKKDERYYNILGATHNNNRVPFEAENVTVADAIAKAGGLDSNAADPAMVIVMRRENPDALEQMNVPLEGNTRSEPIPTVYRFDLTQPRGMFLAQKMQLRNNDVVYASAHPFTNVEKLLGVVRDAFLIKLITN